MGRCNHFAMLSTKIFWSFLREFSPLHAKVAMLDGSDLQVECERGALQSTAAIGFARGAAVDSVRIVSGSGDESVMSRPDSKSIACHSTAFGTSYRHSALFVSHILVRKLHPELSVPQQVTTAR